MEIRPLPLHHLNIRREGTTRIVAGGNYTMGRNRIELGNLYMFSLSKLLFVLNHETLHHLLYHIVGEEATVALDRMEPSIDNPWVNNI